MRRAFLSHLGEEDCLRSWQGSGTIFFTHCNLKCVFCLPSDALIATEHGLRHIKDLFSMGRDEKVWRGGFVRFLDGKVRVYGRTDSRHSRSMASATLRLAAYNFFGSFS